VAHDFNNLLTVVLGNARQIRKTAAEPSLTRRLDMIVLAAERGANLTRQMLAFSRRQKLAPRPVDLNDTVRGMQDLLQSTLGANIYIETRLAAELWPAMIDPTQIELMILNLAINARDAMGAGGGHLTIFTANVERGAPARPEEPPPGPYVQVSVGDTGSGMTPEVLARVFEPFFTTKEVGKGSGLGLSQVFGLAKQSGGGVRIDTQPGQGATVSVYLPRAGVSALKRTSRPEPAARAPRNAVVLLVDDDDAVRSITAGILKDLGYGVMEASSGAGALEAVGRTASIDLVLLDFAMPGMNGAEVARIIRAQRPELPIIFATGYADTTALVETEEACVVHKPFMENELAMKVRAGLERVTART